MSGNSRAGETILVVRLGAMGDILHAFPAVASLRLSFPEARIVWVTRRRWLALLNGAPFVDETIALQGWSAWAQVRGLRPSLAFDFQGLVQSAVVARFARPKALWGFDRPIVRESLARFLYTHRLPARGPHRIERNLQLTAAAGASRSTVTTWAPAGAPEGALPSGPFVLASPFAGWAGKQWPLDFYAELGTELRAEGLQLVLNVSEAQAQDVRHLSDVYLHVSSLPGLIDATRKAVAVVGVDSGPLHLAAAMRKPGVAIFGPTDPAATGPFGGSMSVMRNEAAETTYIRHRTIQASMRSIAPAEVADALRKAVRAVELR